MKEKKTAGIGLPLCLNKDKLVYKWVEQLTQYLSDKIGVRNVPFTYLLCPEAQPPAILANRTAGQPYSED